MTYCIHYNAFKVFGKVAARLDPQPLGLSFSSLEEILQSIKDKAVVERRRIFDGFVVSGTFEEIAKVRSLLQKIIPISSHQGKREPVQTDCRKSVYPKAIRESPRADKSFFEPANGQKHPNRNLTGKANLRESQGRGLNQRINMVNSKETNKEEDKLVHPETLTYGSAVPLFDLPGAESSSSVEQKRESVKTELRSRGRNQYQAKATRTEDSMTTAERKRKTDEARKLEDELKKSQILGVGKRWLSREEAEKFSDLGGPQIMAQNHKRSTDLSDYKKHKVENTFLDEKNIDTRREIPIQKVTNKEIGEMSQGTTTESSAIKKSFVEDDPNERTENTELVMVTTSDDASGSTSEPAPFPYGTELRSNNQNQDETKPFETLSRKQQGGNNNGLRGVKEKGNSPLDSGGEAVRSDHIEENDMDETQRNEICEKQVQPQSKNPKSPNESIKELESTISRREGNHIKFSTETGITVVLLEGDITNHHADLLIRPINPSLCHKERLSNQFQDRGGTLLKDECQRSTQGQETPNYGEVYFTDSGNLPCKAILHAILPLWTEEKKDTKDLKHLIHVCLKKGLILASEHGHRSVALPPLGQEGNPIPVRVSAQVTTRVIASFSRSVSPLHNGVTDLHIVCNDDATFNVFAKQLREFSFRDKQRPYFVQAEDKTVPYQSIGRYGTELKTVEHSSLKGTPRQENQNTTMLPVSKTDLASQPASLSHGTKSRRNNLIRNETKPCKALPKNRQDDDDNSRLKNVKEEENAFLENGGEAVTNHPKDETMFTEALKQSEICGEEAHQQPKSPNSDESIEDAESSTIVMGNNHVKFSAETGITVMLLKGNVTSHNADVLISPANPSLCYKEGLSRQIQETGGRSLKDECLMITQGQKMLKYGEVLVTGSGNLPYKAVLHAILPLWTDDKEEKKELKCQIHACLKSGLILASGHRHRSVAFPLLGQEWNPIPVQVSAEVITRVIATFSKSVGPLHSGVTDFHIVCEDAASFKAFAKELEEFSFPHKQQKHFVTRKSPDEIFCQSAAFSISLKPDSVPKEDNGMTQMVSHREEIVTSLTEIKSSEELSARNEEMTTIEVDDFTRPVEVRAFEILEATSGRRLSQLVGELSQSFPDGESIKREMGEELKRDEFEEQVTENHDFEKKSSAQLQQSTAVDPFSKREEMGQRHAQRNMRHITKPPPLSMGKKTIVRRISNSSSLQDGGRMLKGFMSPTIEALMNADLHLGAQGLKLLHDDDGNVKKKEALEKSFLLDSHDENCSTAFSVPHLDGHQSDDNMPQNCGRKVEKILDSDMELGTLDILERTNQNSPSVREKDEKNGSHTLPEKNGR